MTDRPNVLVPIRVLEGESIPEGVPELLANAHVVLLGYHVVPDQTAAGQ
ncbi:MAG: universal stress protein, partial [Halodesulfurarchaeum sp.]